MKVLSDFRYAMRSLRGSPGFTVSALAILGLGIGSATSIFTAMNAVLLRPLPYSEPGQLISVCETDPSVDRFCVASPPDVEDWAASTRTLSDIGFARSWGFLLRTDEGSMGVSGGYATPGWFATFRVRPQLGRVFEAGDQSEGSRHVAILTHSLWQERFGGDPEVIGRTIPLDGEAYTVVGVLPADFVAPELEYVRLWTPPPWDPRDEERRSWRGFEVTARLAPGSTIQQAGAELSAVQSVLAREHPQTNEGWGVRVLPLHELITGSTRPIFLVFSAGVALLLLIACANLANLVLVRSTQRRREMAVRAAIGAGRGRLVSQLLTESVLLAGGGGVLGLLLAYWATPVFVRLAPAGIPRLDEAHVGLASFVAALALAFLTAAIVGVVPAFWATRVDLARALREGAGAGQPRGMGRARQILVAVEIALTVVLLIGAGLLGRSLDSLLRWSPGFDREGLLTFSAFASTETYATTDAVGSFWRRVEDELGTLPGVTSVGAVSAGPVFGGIEPGRFAIAGRPVETDPPSARWYDASPRYFRTMGIPIRRGRDLEESDVRGGPIVAVINETFARRWFADTDPIGQHVHMLDMDLPDVEIVGIAADVAPFYAGQPVEPEIWWSNRQLPRWGTFFVVRGSGDPGALVRAIRQRLTAIDPDLQMGTPNTIAQLVDRRLIGPRFNLALVGLLAAVALVLAIAGLYSVLSYVVAMRRREIAIRMALGADRGKVLGGVLAGASVTVALGLLVGGISALVLSRFAASLLYGVAPDDPVTFVVTLLILAAVAFLASAVPAMRATRVDPAGALRQE
jgi:putative ABC transport system permease protein